MTEPSSTANGTASTAFIGNNDMTALGIMDAITKLGYKIPFDYSVCGFDNIPLASMKQISLTTIEHATVQKGHEAVDLIHKNTARIIPADSLLILSAWNMNPA